MTVIMSLIGFFFPPETPQFPDVNVIPEIVGFEAVYVPPGHVGPIIATRSELPIF